MKCPHCQREIALAKTCPYCGCATDTDQKASSDRGETSRTKGEFRGRLSRDEARTNGGVRGILPAIASYFFDPAVSTWRKIAILIGFLYVINPIDLIPGALFPVVGWLDDAVVAAITWRLLKDELARHDRR